MNVKILNYSSIKECLIIYFFVFVTNKLKNSQKNRINFNFFVRYCCNIARIPFPKIKNG